MPNQNQGKYVPAGTGPMYWGPGDRVSFLATGADSHGGCFIFEGLTVPGGGPPPHIHHFEDESFYILEGTATFQVGGQTIHAKPGDFIHIPRGTVHSLKNEGKVPARALIITSPAGRTGMQLFVEESFLSDDGSLRISAADHPGAGESDDGLRRQKRPGVGQTGMTMPAQPFPERTGPVAVLSN